MEGRSLLVLRLEGVLQSWGEHGKWDFRDSSSLPTKSAVVGLLGCAMGLTRGSGELVNLAQSLTIAIRADRPGVKFVDYHTVTGAPMMAANGEPRARRIGDTIVTPREYLQDACFTVFLEMEPRLKEKLICALNAPKWCLFLGRKSCVPSRPVLEYTGEGYSSLMDAVFHYPAADRASWPMVYECELPSQTRPSLLRPDGLAGPEREFSLRRVWRGTVKEERNVSDQSGNGQTVV